MEFRVLGPLEIEDGGHAVAVAGAKLRALLTILLLHANETVSRDVLVEELWGERAPKGAAHSLEAHVSRLRRVLRDDGTKLLLTRPNGYLLRADERRVDLLQFGKLVDAGRAALRAGDNERAVQRLREALGLWRGPPLQDVAFEAFAQVEIDRIEERRLAAYEDLAEAELALGRHAEILEELESLARGNPLRERLQAQLMLALYRSGRQAEALDSYQRTRRLLVEELGIDPGSQLRELEQAILRHDSALEPPQRPMLEAPPAAAPATTEAIDEEVRPVTVVVVDVAGATGLSKRLSEDEANALVGDCVSRMSRTLEEFGGAVQPHTGDGICAYFGVPAAHDDDPERAARAALQVLGIVGDYGRDIAAAWGISDFNVRVGIEGGQAAVGRVEPGDAETLSLSDLTDAAARLQSRARPGSIVVGESVVTRLRHRFEFEPLEGGGEGISVSRLVALKDVPRTALHAPVVGREAELAELSAAAEELAAGRGRILLVTGEAGIGKTRLLAELRRAAGEGATWLEGRCQSYGGLRSWPFVEILRDWLGAENDDPEIVVRTKARAKLGAVLGARLAEVLPPLARLLRIELESTLEERIQVPPEELAREVRRAYVAWLEALAERGPVVVAVDDMQWADPSTRELAEEVLQLTDRAPVLFAAAMRIDAPSEGARLRLNVLAHWSHRAGELSLRPLPEAAARRLLSTLLPGALDDGAQSTIIERAEGNPLYVEELLRALVESGGVVERRRTWTFAAGADVAVPPALENVLVTRIDRLPGSARRVAQTAAVIGRTFPVRILEHMTDGEVRSDLLTLLQAGIVKEVRRYPEFECTFKHGLLQEAALSTLLPARRRELYARAAAAFEELYAPSLDDHLERLAYYHALARNLGSALDYLERAASRASSLDARGRADRLAERSRAIAAALGDAA